MTDERKPFFLIRLGLRRPVTLLMVGWVILLLGVVAYTKMPVQLLPSGFTAPFLWVQVYYPNATPTEVEKEVLKPWEELLGTVKGIKRLHGRANSNWAGTFLKFETGTDMTTAYNQIRDRLERLKARLPAGAGESTIWRFNPNDEAILSFAWPLNENYDDLDAFINKNITQPLERLPGVSRVDVKNFEPRKITIEPDMAKLKAFGMTAAELFARLRAENWVLASGKLQDRGENFWVRSVGKMDGFEDYKDIPIRPGLLLRDAATVRLTRDTTESISRLNGKSAIFFEIYKTSDANTVDICNEILVALEQLRQREQRLQDTDLMLLKNQGNEIENAINGLKESSLLGGLIAVFILFVFVRRYVLTAIMASLIPLSLLIAMSVLYFMNESLNIMTFMAFMVAVGMVVDNSVVICEAIDRQQQNGLSNFEAARRGASEVGLAITTSTLTTVVVFLPIGLLGGKSQISFFLEKMGIPVCLALLASLFASLYFVPTMCRFFLAKPRARTTSRSQRWASRYQTLLALCLRKPTWVCSVSVSVLLVAAWMGKSVPNGEHSALGVQFRIHINFPGKMSFRERDDFLRQFEDAALKDRENLRIKTMKTSMEEARQTAYISFVLHPLKGGERTTAEVIEIMRELVPERAGVTHQLGWRESTRDSEASITLSLFGPDSDLLLTLADEVERRLMPFEELSRVEVAPEAQSNEEIQIQIRRDQATRLGLSATDVAGALGGTMRGTQLPLFDLNGEQVEVWVRGQEDWRQNIDEALQMPLARNNASSLDADNQVALQSITEKTYGKTFGSIIRRNRKTAITININTDVEDRDRIYALIETELKKVEWPEQYSYDLGERFEQRRRDKESQMDAFLYALLLVFVLMGVLFESVLLPFSVILSVPFAVAGGFMALYLTNTVFDLTCGVGMVVLVGVIVNNAIVFVDRVQHYVRQGIAIEASLLAAGSDRFRPIVMTASSTIGGLIPMALGDGAIMGVPYASLGIVVIGGLILGTVLTLLFLPTLLQGLYRLREAFLHGPVSTPK